VERVGGRRGRAIAGCATLRTLRFMSSHAASDAAPLPRAAAVDVSDYEVECTRSPKRPPTHGRKREPCMVCLAPSRQVQRPRPARIPI
jgi:hypothetical protein